MPHLRRQREPLHEVEQVVGQDPELEADGVRLEPMAREPRPACRVLPLLDVLLCLSPAVVELDDPVGRGLRVRHDEPYAGEQFPGVPLDLGHHPSVAIPSLRPIAKGRIAEDRLLRRTSHRP